MSHRDRDRSRSPSFRQRAYSPSRPLPRSPPPPPRRYAGSNDRAAPPPREALPYDDRVPPPRRYDDDQPQRRYQDRYDDRGASRRYDGRDNDRYGDRDRPGRGGGDRDERRSRHASEERWERGQELDELHPPRRGGRDAPSEPSRDVIFLGLDPELTETELAGYLRTEHRALVDSTKVVRDRATGISKGFGFAQFSTIEDAQKFVRAKLVLRNWPLVTMPALYPHSETKHVKIDYAGARAERTPAQQPDMSAVANGAHDGTRDIGTPGPNQRVLLLRSLDPDTHANDIVRRLAQEIVRMLGKGSESDAEATITRIAMIVDRSSGQSWGFAFAELVTPELASALVSFLNSPEHQLNGFLIQDVPVAVSFSNPHAFVPTAAGPLGGQFLLRSVVGGGFGSAVINAPDGEYCSYWHNQAGAVETAPRGALSVPPRGSALELPAEMRVFLGTLSGDASKPRAAAVQNMAPAAAPGAVQTPNAVGPIKIGGFGAAGPAAGKKKAKKAESEGLIPIINKNLLGDEDDVDLVGKDSVLLSRSAFGGPPRALTPAAKGHTWIPPTSTSRKVANSISKWNTKQSELSALPPRRDPNAPPKGVSGANLTAAAGTRAASSAPETDTTSAPTPAPPAPSVPSRSIYKGPDADFDFTDTSKFTITGKVACLLCQRQFNAEDTLRKHLAQSDLHKTNLADEATRDAGKRRKAAAAPLGPEGGAYRDRAAERREVFHQPNKPTLPNAPNRKGMEPKAKPPPPPPPPQTPASDEANVGNKLLSKMGWTTGTGLGAERDGRVDPVKVQQFEDRAGLGAARGREAGSWQGAAGWQQRAKDMTRDRFERSGQE